MLYGACCPTSTLPYPAPCKPIISPLTLLQRHHLLPTLPAQLLPERLDLVVLLDKGADDGVEAAIDVRDETLHPLRGLHNCIESGFVLVDHARQLVNALLQRVGEVSELTDVLGRGLRRNLGVDGRWGCARRSISGLRLRGRLVIVVAAGLPVLRVRLRLDCVPMLLLVVVVVVGGRGRGVTSLPLSLPLPLQPCALPRPCTRP